MKKKLIALISVVITLIIGVSLFAACKEDDTPTSSANFTGVTLSAENTALPASLTLPAEGPVSLRLIPEAQGENLPGTVAFLWSIEKGGVQTSDANIVNSIFVSQVAGVYMVGVSATIGTVTHSAQGVITVVSNAPPFFTRIDITGVPATLPMPSSGPASVQLTATAVGTNLPASIAFAWTVQKEGGATIDATIADGLFSADKFGEYTVTVSATVGTVSRTAQAVITVTDPNAVILNSITLTADSSLPAMLSLADADPAVLQLTASAAGQNLPADIVYTWTVEKHNALTQDATITDGLFSSSIVGTYTVKASATVEGQTRQGTAVISVANTNETMSALISRVEQSDNETVKKSIAVQFALRQAKAQQGSEERRAALSDAYWTAFTEYPESAYTIITATGPIWASHHVGDFNPNSSAFNNFRFPATAVFRNSDGAIVDIFYNLPTGPFVVTNSPNNNTHFYDDSGAPLNYWTAWTTAHQGHMGRPGTYLDVLHHFIYNGTNNMTAQNVRTFTNIPGRRSQTNLTGGANNNNHFDGMFYAQQTVFVLSGATESSSNFTSSLVVASQQFMQTPQGQALLG
ncbi:MAG: hypothetical protein FWH03_08650 [Firmicutes bacterium]|nr:hypothetical protein [Bacillota bacterium]